MALCTHCHGWTHVTYGAFCRLGSCASLCQPQMQKSFGASSSHMCLLLRKVVIHIQLLR
jgi:hypothetical protein